MHSGSARTLCRQIQGPGIPVHRLRLLTPGGNPAPAQPSSKAWQGWAFLFQLLPTLEEWSGPLCSWPGMKGTHLHRIIAKGIVQDSWVTGR